MATKFDNFTQVIQDNWIPTCLAATAGLILTNGSTFGMLFFGVTGFYVSMKLHDIYRSVKSLGKGLVAPVAHVGEKAKDVLVAAKNTVNNAAQAYMNAVDNFFGDNAPAPQANGPVDSTALVPAGVQALVPVSVSKALTTANRYVLRPLLFAVTFLIPIPLLWNSLFPKSAEKAASAGVGLLTDQNNQQNQNTQALALTIQARVNPEFLSKYLAALFQPVQQAMQAAKPRAKSMFTWMKKFANLMVPGLFGSAANNAPRLQSSASQDLAPALPEIQLDAPAVAAPVNHIVDVPAPAPADIIPDQIMIAAQIVDLPAPLQAPMIVVQISDPVSPQAQLNQPIPQLEPATPKQLPKAPMPALVAQVNDKVALELPKIPEQIVLSPAIQLPPIQQSLSRLAQITRSLSIDLQNSQQAQAAVVDAVKSPVVKAEPITPALKAVKQADKTAATKAQEKSAADLNKQLVLANQDTDIVEHGRDNPCSRVARSMRSWLKFW